MADKKQTRSAQEIEADIKVTREHLSGTVDELAFRASPGQIKRRQTEKLKAKASGAVNDAVYDADGNVRMDRLAIGLGSVSALALVLGLARLKFRN